MYNHNKAQQSKNRVHISWDILYTAVINYAATSLNVIEFDYFLYFHSIFIETRKIHIGDKVHFIHT